MVMNITLDDNAGLLSVSYVMSPLPLGSLSQLLTHDLLSRIYTLFALPNLLL